MFAVYVSINNQIVSRPAFSSESNARAYALTMQANGYSTRTFTL